jgi:hypothetical protein
MRTLEVTPNSGEMVKPAELIEFKGASKLTLADRRLFNVLLRTAFGPDLATENRRFEILIADLRETHESNDRLVQSIEALMTTVVTIMRPDGSTERVPQSVGQLNFGIDAGKGFGCHPLLKSIS